MSHSHDQSAAEHVVDHSGHEDGFRRRFWVCLFLTFPVLFWSSTIQDWLGYSAPTFTGSVLIVPLLSTVIFVYGGLPFLQMASVELRNRQPGMMTLISLAITVAFAFSLATLIWDDLGADFFWELVTLIDVMLLGHWIEMRSVRLASGALQALADLLPETAELVGDDGRVRDVYLDELSVGDVVSVKPGSRAPADGSVIESSTEMDESMITGESRPVLKEPGDEVIAGTINDGRAAIRVKVTALGEETALAGIMRLVAEAKASKSQTQLLADRAAAFLFYAALIAAGITAVVWTAVDGGVSEQMVARVVTVLVIACPHALGLAIPLVVANTTSIAAANGTLIRNRDSIDTARELDVVVFDKTGTLTEGRIGVTGLTTVAGVSKRDALIIAAASERDSEHVIGRALRQEVEGDAADLLEVTDFEAIAGRGVAATVEGAHIHVGGPRMLEQLRVELPAELRSFGETFGSRGESVVYLVEDGEAIAAFAFADVIREESRLAVEQLHEMGLKVAMLTGDSRQVARSVAAELDIDRFFAEVLPRDKAANIEAIQADGEMVAMVGDGVNDAPALARADIGVAIGSGTDVAVETADLVLVKNNPLDIVRVIRLSEAAYRKQRQNIWWAAGYNIVMIPLAAGVLAPFGFVMPPAVGALVMSVSTIVVAINAQLLRKVDLGS
ncbi:MAG TPA: heavy metal translocating P-type ATPase [Acidimicrobiia bacterium]|nr:heavy metal translocating P-type ATPase [Acidimicrobiia bacterium]